MDKYREKFADSNGRRAALELCCFCRKVTDLNHPETCVHFAEDYVDKSCYDCKQNKIRLNIFYKAFRSHTGVYQGTGRRSEKLPEKSLGDDPPWQLS